ncbi:MAG TPA: GNAT family N-acetyltransferase [Candidatus Binatia bacterium]|nr:GNAT family N-acetyltransferase [Candidatus Binatia bacterium]
METIRIRDARDPDGDALIALLGAVFAEYPGCVLDVDGELPELRAIASAFARWNGRFWVATRSEQIVGCVGFSTSDAADGVELRKLYVARDARRGGLGNRLCALVEQHALARGARFIELWTDTRFVDAHRLYERRGYVRGPQTRELHDLSNTVEYSYRKPLGA